MTFTPKFVDLVRNFTTVQGSAPVVLGSAVSGYSGIADVLTAGDQFYYCIQGVDKPQEREVGRGTLQADGKVARQAVLGGLTNFSSGTKAIAVVAAAEWFDRLEQVAAAGGGASIEAASRAALASSPASRGPAMLSEAGRQGLFLFQAGNLSAEVSADPRQGVFVAPASDPSGANGAWVRRFDGPVMVDWFGAVGDDATNDGPAFAAALDFLDRNRVDYQGAQTLRCGARNYYLGTSQLNIRTTLVFEGASRRATQLRWAANSKGIVVQRANTADGTTVGGEWLGAGDDSIIRQMTLKGAWLSSGAVPEGEFHGIELRARATLADLDIRNFQGDGIFSRCVASSGGANEGNSNVSQITRVRAYSNRNGLYCDGPDANVWTVSGCDFRENRQWGVWDSSFLGNSYLGVHTAANGRDGAQGSAPTGCIHNNRLYMVVPGQEAWCSLNPPTGADTDNQGWTYRDGTNFERYGVKNWALNQPFRSGGAFRSDDNNATNVWNGCYAEGDQNQSVLNGRDLVLGGLHQECGIGRIDGGFNSWGGYVTGSSTGIMAQGQVTAKKGLFSEGADNRIGPTSGPTANSNLVLGSTGPVSAMEWRFPTGQSAYIYAQEGTALYINSVGKVVTMVGEAQIFETVAAGLNLATGKILRVNGTQVVGAQGAAVADATDAASAITQLNALLARLRAHGLIAS